MNKYTYSNLFSYVSYYVEDMAIAFEACTLLQDIGEVSANIECELIAIDIEHNQIRIYIDEDNPVVVYPFQLAIDSKTRINPYWED